MALPFFAGTLSRKRGNRSWNEPLLRKFEILSGFANICNGLETFLHGVLLFISRMTANAIRGLDNIPSGYDRRRLSAEWARGAHGRHRDGPRMTVNQRRTKTLFFETQEDATKALHCLHMIVVSVEYALKDDSERGGRYDSP
ncbi:hypothetical protein OIU76_005651 [Salix suchowensis]|nr:hypothetical protein OIU76_005651 [Salix suchowensis]